MQWTLDDELTERIAVTQLYELRMGSREEIAAVFGISVKSVYNYIRIFTAKGSVGLEGKKKGPKEKLKINAEVRGKILYLFLREGIA